MKIKSLLVLAISSAAFMSSCACSNYQDQQFLNQINETLAKHAEIVTCHDAINVLKSENIDIFEHTFSYLTYEFAYDFDAKQFVIMQGDTIECAPGGYRRNENNFSYFKFTDVYNGNSKYSQYLIDNYAEPETLYVTTGIDVGNHKDIKNITYAGSVGFARNIKIRTYCDYLTIHADSDDVSYYGVANNIFVNEVKTIDIYGETSYVQLRDGTTTFKSSSKTDFVEVPDKYQSEVTVKQEEKAYIACSINVDGIGEKELHPTEVSTPEELEDALDEPMGFVRLTWDINYFKGSITIDSGKTFIIDLNGFAITLEDASFEIESTASCYIIDTEYSFNENCGIFLTYASHINVAEDAYLLINGGSVIDDCYGDEGAYLSPINVSGTFDMYGGKITTEMWTNSAVISQNPGSTVNIYYGTILSYKNIFNCKSGTLKITAGKFSVGTDDCLLQMDGGNLEILGGTFDAYNCMYLSNESSNLEVNISGGNFYSEEHYVEMLTGSTILVEDASSFECKINIDSAYFYSHYGYIMDIYSVLLGDGAITVNCNSGTYDYYLGDGIKVMEGLEEKVMVKKGGTWTNHPYA